MQKIRNICIIAHVDHGKTTLVDHLLRQSGTFREHEHVGDRVMDSMDLEREKGITIAAKNTTIRIGDTKVNIVDTPGHADFGGEVERILDMVDGACLLVDAAEGPLPQTRFVLQKALSKGLRVLLVVNKVDRKECEDGQRTREVVDEAFYLFDELGATEEQLDFPIVYACARAGWCTENEADIPDLISGKKKGSLEPLCRLIVEKIPAPRVEEGNFRMLISNISYSDYVGRLAIGRVVSGSLKEKDPVYRLGVDSTGQEIVEKFNATKIYSYEGLKQVDIPLLEAGDIGILAGTENFEIGDTVSLTPEGPRIARIKVEEPTLGMIFTINTSPFSGEEGEAVQSRKLKERLMREIRHNVALRFAETEKSDQFRILGRGELQFAILIEQMRREGLEFMVGKPTVLYQKGEGETILEPIENVVLDFPETFVGDIMQLFQSRKGQVQKYETLSGKGDVWVRLVVEIPTRGLLGLRSKFLTLTKGNGLMNAQFSCYAEHRGQLMHRINGALVNDREGKAVEYALLYLEERGVLFVSPGDRIYEGMIIGENKQENDMNVNATKEKKLTNIRAASAEVLVVLKGIRKMSLEQCLEWIDEDEWIEITPQSIRLRKKVLAANQRSVKRYESLGQ